MERPASTPPLWGTSIQRFAFTQRSNTARVPVVECPICRLNIELLRPEGTLSGFYNCPTDGKFGVSQSVDAKLRQRTLDERQAALARAKQTGMSGAVPMITDRALPPKNAPEI